MLIMCSGDCYWSLVCSDVLVCSSISTNRYEEIVWQITESVKRQIFCPSMASTEILSLIKFPRPDSYL